MSPNQVSYFLAALVPLGICLTYIFGFDQFVYADLKPYGEHQQLRLVFVTHEA